MKRGLFLFFVFCVISNAYSSDECLQRPSCEELGYVQSRKMCACFNKDVLPCPFNIEDDNTVFCGDLDCADKCKDLLPLYDGQENTKKIIAQVGNIGLAAYAAHSFYVSDKDGDFGQGKWYLPSIGELMDFYGTDNSEITNGYGDSGSTGANQKLINKALTALKNAGVDTQNIFTQTYWSSSENASWLAYRFWSVRSAYFKHNSYHVVRPALLLRGIYDGASGKSAPQIGNVVYLDKTYGAASDYDANKIPVGVVASVSETGKDVTIINLKDLTFSDKGTVDNFDPDHPYDGAVKVTLWQIGKSTDPGIADIPDISYDQLMEMAHQSCNCGCSFYGEEISCDLTAESCVNNKN